MSFSLGESRTEFVEVRGLRYRLRHWGEEGAPRLMLLHGWADVSATFQFIAQPLARHWHLIAPDWRGCGDSQWLGQTYLLTELACDLEVLLTHFFGAKPALVAGHSMGANVAALLAGANSARVAALAMLDAYGTPYQTPVKSMEWIAEMIANAGQPARTWGYPSLESMQGRLMRANPRLTNSRAQYLASELAEVLGDGSVRMRVDPAWRDTVSQMLLTPSLYKEAWRRIEAPVLLVGGPDSYVLERVRSSDPQDFPERLACLRRLQHVVLRDAGHNVHHDQPEAVASLLDEFFRAAVT